ncbi:MAG: histone deacetylase family protein [Chloroflexi bacterium]|nr:histone deacetylase family protein [Chloroflexota bacterium]MBI3339527.1 histone deacetylase family protein [Chloroflexota bacterium]
MKIFYSEGHRQHNPPFEVFDGGERVPYLENPDRMDKVLAALRKTDWAEFAEPSDFGLDPILAVHDADYINFLDSAWTEWLAAAPEAESASDKSAILPATFALRRKPRVPKSFLGRAGYYMMDLSAVIVEGTYKAALASANCALSAAQFIATQVPSTANRPQSAFALCRPPGHHAGKDYCAGYCFINNAAVAANWLSSKGKVALLDIDYHAGNGTQDIFYDRADVLTISIHADPDFEYPHFIGFADETGAGAGLGFHHNFPLPAGTDDAAYLAALDKALELIMVYGPWSIVVSAGMDIYDGDPLGKFKVTRDGIREIGERIANLRLPTAVIMEGGYANNALGKNIGTFLEAMK